jgi:HSP20 family molecular chaperone IbpA
MAFEPFDEFFRRMRRMFRDFDREFAEIDIRGFERRPGISGFKIEIRDHGTGKPEVKVTRLGKPPAGVAPIIEEIPAAPERRPAREEVKPPEAKPFKPIKCMLETNVGKVERLDEVVLTMQAPDVKKEDVEVRRLGNTLELIARKRTGEAYFGAFELPPDAIPSEYTVEVKDGMLVVTIPRRRRHGIRA